MPGAAVPRKAGGLVVALEHGFHFLDWETEKLTLIADPETEMENNRFNDGKCDEAGRCLAGSLSFEEQPLAALYCLDVDQTVRKLVDGVTCSNGISWSPDGRTMYYIDSPTKRVVAYDYEVASGALSDQRTVVTIPEDGGVPDGMSVDVEGMIWVAQWGGWQVSRWNPQTGEQLSSIALPVAQVTSCTFGGPNLDEMYITTAHIGQTANELAKQPKAGGIFHIKLSIAGLPTNFYGG
jgi:sugar lactone lactonase YvrE